jgi:hypothetical protein
MLQTPSPSTLRLLWTVVENIQPNIISDLSDVQLIRQVLHELQRLVCLAPDESSVLSDYLGDRTMLIRDITEG